MATAARKRSSSKKELQVPILERGLAVLELLARREGGATIAELSGELAIAGASVFRITRALTALGYLERDGETKRFRATRKFLAVGQPTASSKTLGECALEPMRRLRSATGETTQLCCLSEVEMVILDQLPAKFPFKYTADLGARCPAYSCAPGKAMLAFLPADERDEIVGRIKFKRFTETTLLTKTALGRELTEIAATGYALDRAEGMPGIHCVAAPILDRHGYPIAAVTIAGPATRVLPERFEEFAGFVMEAARAAGECFNA